MENDEGTQEPESPPVGNDEVSPSVIEALGMGETQSEPPQGEQDAAREEHKERTRLGRRLTQFEQEVSDLKRTLSRIDATLSQRQEPFFDRAIAQPVEDKSPVEYIATPDDLEKHLTWREKKEAEKKNAYAGKYVHVVKNLAYINSELHPEIEAELFTNVAQYPTYSDYNDPTDDAKRNYLIAENRILKQRIAGAQPRANVKGGPSSPPGITSNSRQAPPPERTIKLDEHAKKFLQGIGESSDADWVKKSLGGDK